MQSSSEFPKLRNRKNLLRPHPSKTRRNISLPACLQLVKGFFPTATARAGFAMHPRLKYLLSLRYLPRHLPSCSHLVAQSQTPSTNSSYPPLLPASHYSTTHLFEAGANNNHTLQASIGQRIFGWFGKKLKLNFHTHTRSHVRRNSLDVWLG